MAIPMASYGSSTLMMALSPKPLATPTPDPLTSSATSNRSWLPQFTLSHLITNNTTLGHLDPALNCLIALSASPLSATSPLSTTSQALSLTSLLATSPSSLPLCLCYLSTLVASQSLLVDLLFALTSPIPLVFYLVLSP